MYDVESQLRSIIHRMQDDTVELPRSCTYWFLGIVVVLFIITVISLCSDGFTDWRMF